MVRPSVVRFAIPVSTPPGPSSAKSVTPSDCSLTRLWRHRTGLDSCAESRLAQSPPASWGFASTFDTTGMSVSRGSAAAIALRSRSRADVMNGVWNAPDTCSDMTRFAPSSFAWAAAASTPSGEPAITTWPGALKFATQTSASARSHATPTWSSSRPRTAAIVPGRSRPASCIAAARSDTSCTPSSKPRAPVAVSAVYSPRLWPAQKLASMPIRLTASSTTRLDTNVVSWALRVSRSSSASASHSSAATSRPAMSLASSTSSQLSWSRQGRPIPGRWDPCPGNVKASMIADSRPAARRGRRYRRVTATGRVASAPARRPR